MEIPVMRMNPETLYRKLAENPKASQSARIGALRFLTTPPLAMLSRIANNPETPGRLAAVATDLFAQQVALKQLKTSEADAAN